MDEELSEITNRYAERYSVVIRERLGFGVHGTVFVVERKAKPNRSAVKFLEHADPYRREKQVYQRLAESQIVRIEGFNVPQLLSFDDELRAIEMTIVKPPFVLDFAGARLDDRVAFSEETMTEWEEEKRKQFGQRWEVVKSVLSALETLDVYVHDVSPGNVAFRKKS